MRIEVIRAWPRRHESVPLELPAGACVADAVRMAGWDIEGYGIAIFGERADLSRPLQDGDRVEVLRPLTTDPKEARRRRALKRDG